jgi:hypothetical protein
VSSPLEDEEEGTKIAGSGTSQVVITYSPETADTGTKIVFLQVVRTSLDGTAVKPGTASPKYAHLDADTTAAFRVVDHMKGEKDPYYNGDDSADGGVQGNATTKPKVDATMDDTPGKADSTYPAFYELIDWVYDHEKGKGGKATVGSTAKGDPGTDFNDAVALWNKNHGFKMP